MAWALLHHTGNEKWNNTTHTINWKTHINLLPPNKMTLEVYSWHIPGLQIGKGVETTAISCPDDHISQPQSFQARGPAWAAAFLPEKHPIWWKSWKHTACHCPLLVASRASCTPSPWSLYLAASFYWLFFRFPRLRVWDPLWQYSNTPAI